MLKCQAYVTSKSFRICFPGVYEGIKYLYYRYYYILKCLYFDLKWEGLCFFNILFFLCSPKSLCRCPWKWSSWCLYFYTEATSIRIKVVLAISDGSFIFFCCTLSVHCHRLIFYLSKFKIFASFVPGFYFQKYVLSKFLDRYAKIQVQEDLLIIGNV